MPEGFTEALVVFDRRATTYVEEQSAEATLLYNKGILLGEPSSLIKVLRHSQGLEGLLTFSLNCTSSTNTFENVDLNSLISKDCCSRRQFGE